MLEALPLSSAEAMTTANGSTRARECTYFTNDNGHVAGLFETTTLGTSVVWYIDRILAIDAWNHGDSAILNRAKLTGNAAADIIDVLEQLQVRSALVGVGHSFGATTLLLAELMRPALLDAILAMEPVLAYDLLAFEQANFNYILRRKAAWPSADHADQHVARHPYFRKWDPRVRRLYRAHALTTSAPQSSQPSSGNTNRPCAPASIHLKCHPRDEFATYRGGYIDGRWTTDHLGEIICPVRFLLGEWSTACPNDKFARAHASASLLSDAAVAKASSHLLLMESPDTVAQVLVSFLQHAFDVRARLELRAKL
ncbi:hypothetical protein IWQ60_003760 [Tieghemiomyces parasiticus]|uniref:AB hydrolase-1 domain-containing protein n=1 Tax=Tieghemiomyces parasiticus TaxID=78921 RepID=A0A9W8AGZ7_9FUNG|nr:hypothetical protein IWQ60_003760 [Tieghemiomyces parasiticus]